MRAGAASADNAVRVALLLTPIAAGCYALYLGQDASWDLRNYHYYNPFAFLTGRMGHDIAIAHVATYYNPALHLPFYWAVNSLSPRAVGFGLALFAGFNTWLLYFIARQAIHFERSTLTVPVCGATAFVGTLGAMNLAELGTSYGDNLVSLPVLASLWLVLRFRTRLAGDAGKAWPVALGSGLLSGAALGLKMPFAVYAVALFAALFALQVPLRRRLLAAMVFGLGVLAGGAATCGYWVLQMWRRFGNPLFPYWNQYFQSPWATIGPYRDGRFMPQGLLKELLFPFRIGVDPLHVSEVPFRDLRLTLLYALMLASLAALGLAWMRHRRAPANVEGAPERAAAPIAAFLTVFSLVAFFVWMKLFAVYRYLMVVEMLAPLVALLLLIKLIRHERMRWWVATAASLAIIATVQPANWGRRPWGDDYFGVEPPPMSQPERTIVLVAGYEPTAYMVPFFPRPVRFLRVQGYFTGPSAVPNQTDRLMHTIVARHDGPLYLLYASHEEWSATAAAKAYRLRLDRCATLTPRIEPAGHHFRFCRCRRT